MSKSAKRNAARARRLLELAARLGVEVNRDLILAKVEAWDAEIAKRRYSRWSTSLLETWTPPGNVMRQTSFEFGARSAWPRKGN